MRENIGLFIWLWILIANAALLLLSGLRSSPDAGGYREPERTIIPESTPTVSRVDDKKIR